MSIRGILFDEAKNSEINHFYKTPSRAIEELLVAERFSGPIWEPAAGTGNISEMLIKHGYDVISSDLIERGYCPGGIDFLEATQAAGKTLITNPPFKLALEFALKCIDLQLEKFALFNRLAWLESLSRYKQLWSKYPPSTVYIFPKRATCWRGDLIDPKGSGGIPFAWYVWDRREQSSAPTLKWLTPA